MIQKPSSLHILQIFLIAYGCFLMQVAGHNILGAAVKQSFTPNQQPEGDAAIVTRVIGGQYLKNLDPFLMLDFFKVRLPAGFPDHPHRGFETVTYMVEGTFYHEDFKGHKGILSKGDVQWMTAGKGIVHAEMPGSFDTDSIGFQLWINLPQSQKLIDPHYQEFKSSQIKEFKADGLSVKVITGNYENLTGLVETRATTKFLDVHLKSTGTEYKDFIDMQVGCFLYVYQGKVKIRDTVYNSNTGIVLETPRPGQVDYAIIKSETKLAKFIFLCAKPLREITYSRGTFVMTSQWEVEQAQRDFNEGKNGFEGARTWESEIKHLPRTIRGDL